MSERLPAVRAGLGLMRMPREVGVAVRTAQATALVASAQIEAVTMVTAAGYHAVASLSELETRLIMRSPLAEPRLRFIGDTGAARIAEIIERTRP